MRKAERLFQLTNLIRSRQPITAEQIAEELNVSVRTVYRYIDDLSVSGIPIYGTTGVGYQLDEQFELPPLNLTEKELDALLVGVNMVSTWTGNELSEAARSLAHKIEAVIPKSISSTQSINIFAPDLFDRKKERECWEALHQAIKDFNTVSIIYQAADGNQTMRTIYPLGLFYWGGKWTVGSWCTLRQDFRDFRLDRILEITTETETFKPSSMINLDAYFTAVEKDILG